MTELSLRYRALFGSTDVHVDETLTRAKMNFVLPPLSLSALASSAIIARMWQLSLSAYKALPDQDMKEADLDTNTMVRAIQVSHRQSTFLFDRMTPVIWSNLNELDMTIAGEVLYFLKNAVGFSKFLSKSFPEILKDHVQFTMDGSVNYQESWRSALPYIADKTARFSIITKFAIVDMLEVAWEELPLSGIKFYLDLWEGREEGALDKLNSEVNSHISEIYFMLFEWGKLDAIDSVKHVYAWVNDATEYLFMQAINQGLADLAKYCYTITEDDYGRKRLLNILMRYIRENKYMCRTKVVPDVKIILSVLQGLLMIMNKSDIMAYFQHCWSELIRLWVLSDKYLPLIMPLLPVLFELQQPDSGYSTYHYGFSAYGRLSSPYACSTYGYSEIAIAFSGFKTFSNSQTREKLFIEIWRATPAILKASLLTQEASSKDKPLLLGFGHDVAAEMLKGQSKTVVFGVGLPFCKAKLKQHNSNHTYVYYTFTEDIVPVCYREEFLRLLESEKDVEA